MRLGEAQVFHGENFKTQVVYEIIDAMFFTELDLELIRSVMKTVGISNLKVVMESSGYCSLDSAIFEHMTDCHVDKVEPIHLLLDFGNLFSNNRIGILNRIINESDEADKFICWVNFYSPFMYSNAASLSFITNPIIKEARPADCRNDCTTLEQHFFAICRDSAETAKVLVSSGVDARKRIGSGIFAKLSINHRDPMHYDELFNYMLELDWTREDFESILVSEDLNLLKYFCALDQKVLALFE